MAMMLIMIMIMTPFNSIIIYLRAILTAQRPIAKRAWVKKKKQSLLFASCCVLLYSIITQPSTQQIRNK
jgi:hypothetical protein